uniref:EF-hand domain-containing protein n=1 Tax=Palpitomonas bilix TaxID=652834 RepID=A0A7S3DEM7_9EUKA|mmetsp:Transcript_3377/g.6627  ORF Transcript_3377/g.6627 Transcript_3377/m.6627 type:complete len:500 (+) Transcript_3377:269-1768(+)
MRPTVTALSAKFRSEMGRQGSPDVDGVEKPREDEVRSEGADARSLLSDSFGGDSGRGGGGDPRDVFTSSSVRKWLDKRKAIVPPKLSEQQLLEYRALFNAIDTDGSGSLDVDEIWSAFRKMKIKTSRHEIEELVKRADQDGDMVLSFAEFAIVLHLHSSTNADNRSSSDISLSLLAAQFCRQQMLRSILTKDGQSAPHLAFHGADTSTTGAKSDGTSQRAQRGGAKKRMEMNVMPRSFEVMRSASPPLWKPRDTSSTPTSSSSSSFTSSPSSLHSPSPLFPSPPSRTHAHTRAQPQAFGRPSSSLPVPARRVRTASDSPNRDRGQSAAQPSTTGKSTAKKERVVLTAFKPERNYDEIEARRRLVQARSFCHSPLALTAVERRRKSFGLEFLTSNETKTLREAAQAHEDEMDAKRAWHSSSSSPSPTSSNSRWKQLSPLRGSAKPVALSRRESLILNAVRKVKVADVKVPAYHLSPSSSPTAGRSSLHSFSFSSSFADGD